MEITKQLLAQGYLLWWIIVLVFTIWSGLIESEIGYNEGWVTKIFLYLFWTTILTFVIPLAAALVGVISIGFFNVILVAIGL